MTVRRLALATLVAAVALPAAGYVLPVGAILRRVGEKRASLDLASLEVTGTLVAEGEAADRIGQATGLRVAAGKVTAPARFTLRVPGRCRLDVVVPDVPEADRPYVAIREGRVTGKGLDAVPAAVALVRNTCSLLGVSTVGDADRAWAESLGARGVALGDATLGRFNGRIAYVLGGRERDAKPLAYVDKESFQPVRLVAREGSALLDVRLLDFGSPTGGDWFPRAVEVWEKGAPRLRLTTEKVTANARLPDALF